LSLVLGASNFGQAKIALGEFLKLGKAAPSSMTARVLIDQKFALIVASLGEFPQWKDRLVNDPYNKKFVPPEQEERDDLDLPSISKLIKKAAGAALEWGTSGFAKADPWEIDLRMQACGTCDHRVKAPQNPVYKVAKKLAGGDDAICKLCGCSIVLKASIPLEKCPEPEYEGASTSRWKGEIDKDPKKLNRGK